jgi:flagellar hook-associated protein 1
VPDILNVGTSGLSVAKKSLETTGHNIANVNTEGYSRQRVEAEAATPQIKGGLVHGTGARVKAVRRYHDQYIEKRFNETFSQKHYHETQSSQLERLQQTFNELNSKGLNNVLGKFFNSFRDLANNPENDTVRSVVRDNAELVTQDFRGIRTKLNELAGDIDLKIETQINDINQISKHIAQLNQKIAFADGLAENPNDLMDQRDLAVHTLSEFFDINCYVDNQNLYVVNIEGLGSLVSGTEVQELRIAKANKDKSTNNMDGSVEIVFEKRPGNFITNSLRGGSLAAVTQMRNKEIRQTQDRIDNLAFNFINTVNAIHRRGYVLRELEVDDSGRVPASDKYGKTTEIDFFKPINQTEGAASQIDLSEDVKADLSNIATALTPNSPGDNRVALAISKVQQEKILGKGDATLEEDYLQMVANIGLKAGKSQINAEQSEGLFNQAKTFKERLTGVSLDEEAANMVKFQHAYEASAKVMQTAKEMMDTLLSIKR